MRTSSVRLSAAEAAQAIRDGRLTSEQLVRDCLARIAAREGEVHAWTVIDADAAIATARELDRTPSRGPLHGIPIGVKDVIDTRDFATSYNSPIYRDHRPTADARVVEAAKAAGMVVLGKTVTTEFATRGFLGPTRNPNDLQYSPGGSSSGSAAAIADSMVPLALGTQTGGSIVRPASYCGIVGFKPSFDVIGTQGMKLTVPSFDTLGVLARTVEDAALGFHALTGQPMPDFGSVSALKLRVGICRSPFWPLAEPATREVLDAAATLLAGGGVGIVQAEMSALFDGLGAAHDTVSDYEAAKSLSWEWKHHRAQLSPGVQKKLQHGMAIAESAYQAALRLIVECRDQCAVLFGSVDCILTPSSPGSAPPFAAGDTGNAALNKLWTTLYMPCVNVPGPVSSGAMPTGVQVVGLRGRDGSTLLAAERINRILHSLDETETRRS